MTDSFEIAGRPIGPGHPPYVVAEMSANHNGSLDDAKRIIDSAREAGADAVKMQTYRPDTMTLDCDEPDFRIEGGPWHGRRLYDLYEEAHTPWEWHPALFEHARERGITLFSTPFDQTAVDLLEELDAPAYKVASFEIADTPLIRRVAAAEKPVILSTGLASFEEIAEAVDAAQGDGASDLALLHCVSSYPAPAADYNLRTIPHLARRFDVVVGLSDHTLGEATAVASVALGAAIIEKHFTLDRSRGGPDDSFSLEPTELKALVRDARIAWESLGEATDARKESEKANLCFRRSLYFVRRLRKGELIAPDSVRSVRPGHGLPPSRLHDIIGRIAARDIEENRPVREDDLA